jgi:pentatricopeptide repeat protein
VPTDNVVVVGYFRTRTSDNLNKLFAGLPQRRHASAAAHDAADSGVSTTVSDETVPAQTPLRSTPWSFASDGESSMLRPTTALSQRHLQLSRAAELGNITAAVSICAKMKEQGIAPDLTTYNWLLESCAAAGLPLEARAVFEDMSATGIQFDRSSMHHLLKVWRTLSTPFNTLMLAVLRPIDIHQWSSWKYQE